MKHRGLVITALTLGLFGWSCASGGKGSPPTSEAPAVADVRPAPLSTPSPLPEPAKAWDPWSADLAELNAYVQREGLLGDVYFDYDMSDLRSDARQRLSKNADFLRQRSELVILVEGHCDERGTTEYNLALGERRAFAVKSYLASLGIPEARVQTLSFGKERPRCTESAEGCWWQNRRGGFVVISRSSGVGPTT